MANGATIAVAGTGLDRVYPARRRELAHENAVRGAQLFKFSPETPPRPEEHFPRRNRLSCGPSLGTLVVEATLHTGSLVAARMAAEQGREVFAIHGSIHNSLARGCHSLIRQGAKLVEPTQDILEEFGALAALDKTQASPPPSSSRDADDLREFLNLLHVIGFESIVIDTLVQRSGLTAEQVSSMLVVLELHRHIASALGGLYTRIH